ncbi:MAG: bifunctional 4-hydroxy-2-oxoglutarate aldolase/2-dehydro-3-deoxy-phosphogluconate aldolase [Deltaproteobacteria bacterium]|nr:bifunctional 4-hydroxy-2-oxoglutarate aldolase/2-dehydro-3-deoxy-phosphogluconate aldolase [Deltaproteobacteria bacterium]
MTKTELMTAMQAHRLVAVIRSSTAEEALATARAVGEAGIRFVEVTFTVPDAAEVIRTLAGEGVVHVGAGTVLSEEQARTGIEAGARFIVSPSLELDLVPLCREAGVASIPAGATPTEVVQALRAGADLVKIFPADCVGGPHFIRQMLGPFPDARFMVSGGVNKDNVAEYAALGVTGIVLGSAFLADVLAREGHAGLVAKAREFVDLLS